MYQSKDRKTLPLFPELFPLGGALKADNRWLKLSGLMPWDEMEEIYRKYFSDRTGRPAKDARLICGLLTVKHWEGYSDERVVTEFLENPYVQAFCGYDVFVTENVIDASVLSKMRKRLGKEFFKKFEEEIEKVLKDRGVMRGGDHYLDATVIPANLTYPTDTKLLNHAREWLCAVIVRMKKRIKISEKVRTYCRVARRVYLSFQKKRRKTKAQIRKMQGQMLRFVRRNKRQLEMLLLLWGGKLKRGDLEFIRKRLEVVNKIYEQQLEMWKTKTHQVKERIVSLSLPHIRPMVRGKEGKDVEFGPKVLLSWVSGFCFLDHFSFDAFNEGTFLLESLKKYRGRFKSWPSSSTGDGVFGNRLNRGELKELGIRGGFKPLGRATLRKSSRAWFKKKQKQRSSRMEGIIGHLKNHFGLDRIRYRIEGGEEIWTRMGLLSMNLDTALKRI